MAFKEFIQKLGFQPKENTSGIFIKKYHGGCTIEIDFEKQIFNYGNKIKSENKTTQNFCQPENWVVLECVDRLLEKGYKPENIILEKTWPSGHGTSGRLDICVTRDDGSEYLLIECKTYGKEFDKAFTRLKKDGGQLFTYFKFSNKADIIMLYASELKGKEIAYRNEVVKIEEDYRTGDVKDFYDKWSKLTKDNGVFDIWVNPYHFESKAITIQELEDIKTEDSSFIFNRFLEILRHNVVSDKPNAFNKIFTLFLCKIYDEKVREGTDEELHFQWKDGSDDDISFQLRLTDLYKNGMFEFLEKRVTDFSETEFENKFKHLTIKDKQEVLYEINKLRLEKNNEFAIKEVYDEKSFKENATVVKEVVELLQGFKIRYTKKQQYLSDFFELLLTTGLKQESGQFFTPVPIAQFIIKSLPLDTLVKEKLKAGIKDDLLPYVIDYAAGSGHFVTEIMHETQRLIDKENDKDYMPAIAKKIRNWKDDHFDWAIQYVYGIEKDYRLVKVGKVGCYLHGDGLANVIHSDGLANFNHKDYKGRLKGTDKDFPKENKQFDIVISNPPYAVSAFKNAARDYYKDNDFDLYKPLTDNSSEIECLFIERTQQLLKDGGLAGIILPSSILSNAGIYAKAREIILQYFEIIAITELGSNTFMATGTNTVVLFLRRRNNYFSIHTKLAVTNFINTLNDVTINSIEKPVTKYVSHVWQSVTLIDYKTLLEQKPNSTIEAHEIYKEYRKKIKAKNDKEFWDTVKAKETEKLYYFILAYKQQVVLVKSGDKDAEKRFLGYEFSNRRGSEGIHAMQRGKGIDECTELFDADIFTNPVKASTYIYNAFKGNTDTKVSPQMQKHISYHQLVDMLTFDRVEFEKNISLSVKKKVIIESKYPQVKVEEVFTEIKNGKNVNQIDVVGKYRVSRIESISNAIFNIDATKWTNDEVLANDFLLKGDMLLSHINSVEHLGKTAFYNLDEKIIHGVNLLRFRPDKNLVIPRYVSEIFKVKEFIVEMQKFAIKAANQASLNSTNIKSLKIPLPPLNIQQKIVIEIKILEVKERKAKEQVEHLCQSIAEIISNVKGNLIKLQEIVTKIGSGATPLGGEGVYKKSGITLIRSQNVYDGFLLEKGLAFIDEKQAQKLNNVIVEENDILFNITGASIARCYMVEEKYLPARVNQHVSIIRINDKAIPKYVQLVLVSSQYKTKLLQIGEGATSREAITKSQLENFEIPLPSLVQQKMIVDEIKKAEEKIAALEKSIVQTPALKEAILKKYL